MSEHVAVVQVPAYREPDMKPVLDAVAHQERPDGWTIRYEAWVTLDNYGNETWRVADEHPAFVAREAPPGKLSARNTAHDDAFDGDATAVVTWDADVRPAHANVLAAVLEPLVEDRGVIATNGSPKPAGFDPVSLAIRAVAAVEDRARPHLNGQLSAFHRAAWLAAGPFRTDLDQTDVYAVRAEEEFAFYRRLRLYGEVERVPEAVVYEEPRRVMQRLNKAANKMSLGRYPMSEWEETRGAETFNPERDR